MGKQFINVLLCGAMVLSTATYISCSDDDVDDLKNRVTVIEGLIGDMQAQLEKAITTGATILSATENGGVWTLKLSSGETITIKPGSGSGGGSDVTVTKNESSVTITVNETSYVLPLGSFVNTLVYSPEYTDGMVKADDSGLFEVKFLATPTPSAEDLEKATFKIATHELKTRADFSLFEVKEAALDNGFVKVTIQALEDVNAGGTYAGALVLELDGAAAVSSNYFNIAISSGFSFGGEELITPTFASAVTDAKEVAAGFWAATLPEPTVEFLGTFNFKDLFTNLPAGNITFALGKNDDQNDAIKGRYDFFKSCLSNDGTWEMKGRPGTNGAGPDDKPGILVLVKANNVTIAKVYWKVIDPLANVDFKAPLAGLNSQHMEYGEVFEKGANKYDIAKEITAGNFSLKHGKTDEFVEAFNNYSVSLGSDELVFNNGEKLEVSEFGKKFAKFSLGIKWFNVQTSIVASQGTLNEAGEANNGEIIGGWDGISGDDMKNLGLKITEDGFFETTAAYGGWGLRVGMGVEFEYDYGKREISQGVLAYIFFNRRVSPDGVTNLDPR